MIRARHPIPSRVLAALAVAATLAAPGRAQDVAVFGARVYTMAGAPIENGVVLIRDGKIIAVGAAAAVSVPPGFAAVRGEVVTPGLVDARGTVGLTGILNQAHDQDQFDRSEPIQPELRAVDAFDAREPLLAYVRSFGVTTVHTGHGPGPVVSGQTLVAKTRGETVADAAFVPAAMVAGNLGEGTADGKNAPGTRAKAVALLREALVKAKAYDEKSRTPPGDKKPERDLRLDALADVLNGKVPLLLHAESHQDIEAALRLREEFGFRLVLEGCADAPLVLDQLVAARVPVILHPTMARPEGGRRNASFATAAALAKAGVPFAIGSGYEGYVPKTRVVLLEAAIAAANGLTFEQALASITRDAARIAGVDGRVGTLEAGKDGDVAVYDGDPFEYTSHCTAVIVDGRVVSDAPR